MPFQRTLQGPLTLHGVGLHSGSPAQVTLSPAAPHSGVIFVRKDLPGLPEIRGHYSKVVNTQLATTLAEGKAKVSTVEHLLGALHGLGVDNVRVEVSGPEIPILDGSALPFVDGIMKVGIVTQAAPRDVLVLKRKIEVKIGEKWGIAEPAPRLEIHGSIEFEHPSVGHQEFAFIEGETELRDFCGARTFGFLDDVEALKRMGLVQGGSLENAVVVDHAGVINPEGLRYPNEFARHKVLDALGDFKLAGIRLRARIRLHRAGHDLHGQLLTEIFKDATAFDILGDEKGGEDRSSRTARLRAALAGTLAAAANPG